MKFAILANSERSAVYKPVNVLAAWAQRHGFQVFVPSAIYDGVYNPTPSMVRCETDLEAISKSDIVMTSGGDGTILLAARLIKNAGKKILGVNAGKLGFLANIQQHFLEHALDSLLNNTFEVDKRHMLRATAKNGAEAFALNEFLFSKKGQASMITLSVYYDGRLVNKYWADGILVSTPTGSTAYNMSTGGPIIYPLSDVLAITPINPHTLTTRPIVVPSGKTITIEVNPEDQEVLYSNDGEVWNPGEDIKSVEISRSDFTIDMIQLPEHCYFETLRSKLMWGANLREQR